jgi:nucleoid DNA-binding protein
MTKQDFAEKLAAKTGISKATALRAIDCIFSTKAGEGIIATELDANRSMTITGFGTFSTRHSKARRGRNPQTGQPIMIAARNSVSFRGGKGLKERVADVAPEAKPEPVRQSWEW